MIRNLVLLFFIFQILQVSAQDRVVSFNQQYANSNNNKVNIEVNEVQELTYIMMAITDYGRRDSNMVDFNTDYYRSVIEKFSPYKDHIAIKTFNSLLEKSLIYYILISSNAYGFEFTGDTLARTHVYTFPAQGVGTIEIQEDPILQYKDQIEDFAQASGFREFYKNNKPYYEQLKSDYVKYGAILEQKEWLEAKFDYKINSYRVLTSPLIGGINATKTFEDNGFKEMLLYLPRIKQRQEWSDEFNRAMNSRVIFTEIDHNYVGPLSAQYKDKIDAIFHRRDVWVDSTNKSTNHYPNPIKVFDEYLTWGLFILFNMDTENNNEPLLKEVIAHIDSKMKQKGFPKSKEFNTELVRLYKLNPNAKISELYDDLLKWSATQVPKQKNH